MVHQLISLYILPLINSAFIINSLIHNELQRGLFAKQGYFMTKEISVRNVTAGDFNIVY